MAWFNDFVKETVHDWVDAKRIASKYASFETRLTEELNRLDLSPSLKGQIGAEFIAGRLMKKGYTVALSPRSMSPADVWGLLEHDGHLFVPLVQVKAAFTGGSPERLSADDEEDAALFAAYVWEALSTSALVPAEEKQKPKIVSIGYAGVVVAVEEDNFVPKKERSYYINGTYPKALGDYKSIARGPSPSCSKFCNRHAAPWRTTAARSDSLPRCRRDRRAVGDHADPNGRPRHRPYQVRSVRESARRPVLRCRT